MTESARQKRNQDRLLECYPTFRRRVSMVIARLEALGYRPRIQEAWRSPQEQHAAYMAGTSKLKYGFHNVTGRDGVMESLAVDLLDDDHPLAPPIPYCLVLAAIARKYQCETGILWGLPDRLAQSVNEAIAAKDWFRTVKVGWDPLHFQPSDLTISEAKAGKRPG